ncbi:hypothetical protein ACIU1J_31460 [Azospirillum doebereinerae]|uniref:hypothetical protein n=1 Tax=Azospirillum doebereinerae TaxID=92933 RepID=UPI00384DDD4B
MSAWSAGGRLFGIVATVRLVQPLHSVPLLTRTSIRSVPSADPAKETPPSPAPETATTASAGCAIPASVRYPPPAVRSTSS